MPFLRLRASKLMFKTQTGRSSSGRLTLQASCSFLGIHQLVRAPICMLSVLVSV